MGRPRFILHPLLAFYLSSIPLLFFDMDESPWYYQNANRNDLNFLGRADRLRGQKLLSSPQNAHDRLLILSRLMPVALSLLLGIYIYLFSKNLYGWKGGVLALFFFTFCPNMLAHAGLITPDMPLTVFFFITIYYFRKSLAENKLSYFILAGISLGLALLSKFTALVLLPIEALLLAAFFLKERRFPFKHTGVSLLCAGFVLFTRVRIHHNPVPAGYTVSARVCFPWTSCFFNG